MMSAQAKDLPHTLWIVRHGQSAGNVARDLAEAAGHETIEIASRDMDVPLSALGAQQARTLGRWFGSLPEQGQPQAFYFSPYLRARQTAEHIAQAAGLSRAQLAWICDERIREKEFGILDRLTGRGIKRLHPQLSEQRAHVGKFYFRPPGGESWCDVILRLRSMMESLFRQHSGQRVVVVAHQVTVHCLRYLIEGMDEATVLANDSRGDLPNCSVTSYERRTDAGQGALSLALESFVAPLEEAGTAITSEPDVPAAAKP
jgi:broad specificity phosphatase PhoE